jgi:hypothetical protein
MAEGTESDCKTSVYLMMAAVDVNMRYVQTRSVFTPECYIFASFRTQYNSVFFFSLRAALLTV